MPNYYNPYQNYNSDRIDRQIAELTNIKAQMQNTQQSTPVQNIINTNNSPVELEAKYIKNGEDVSNIIISNRTLFIDEQNSKISIKEPNGDISKVYNIVVPKDEKDIKIEELENKVKKMEVMINEFTKRNKPTNEIRKSDAVNNGDVKSTATTNGK